MSICGVILVGGPHKGTRLRPISLEIPKPLILIAAKTVLEHQIENLLNIKELGKIILIGNYEKLDTKLDITNNSDIEIKYINEEILHGTGGSILYLHENKYFDKFNDIIIMNCDIVCKYPLNEMMEFHENHDGKATLMSVEVPRESSVYFGCIVTEENCDKISHYVEKPDSFINERINGGILVLNKSVLDMFKDIYKKNSDMKVDLGRDIYPYLIKHKLLYSYLLEGPWCSIKSPSSALYANKLLLNLTNNKNNLSCKEIGNNYIHPTAIIDSSCHIGPNVSIGPNCILKSGIKVSNAIICENCTIECNSYIKECIIGENCYINKWCRVEGRLIGDFFDSLKQFQNKFSYFNSEGKFSPLISVLGSNVNLHTMLMVYNSIILPHKDITFDCMNEIIL